MCHVLIIEDDGLIAEDLSDLAFEAGATSVDITASPSAALHSALTQQPEVLFSDVQIRDGTGPEAIMEIHKRLGPIPVIFITSDLELCSQCDAAAVLLKPVDRSILIQAFQSAAPIQPRQA